MNIRDKRPEEIQANKNEMTVEIMFTLANMTRRENGQAGVGIGHTAVQLNAIV